MEIKFYSPHIELSEALKGKIEQALDQVVQKAGFLEGGKRVEKDTIRTKVSVEKSQEFHHVSSNDLHPSEIKESGKFKLEIELIFSGQKIRAIDYGDDLYLLVDSVRRKLERETHRYRKKRLKLEKKGNLLWKKLKLWNPKDLFKREK